jgi:transglutaminase-like putative cysteine protease/heme exporter protein D
MTRSTNPKQNTIAKHLDGLSIDVLCSFLVSIGVLLALRQLFRFENPFSVILMRTAAVLIITTLITRRWWHTVLFGFIVLSITAIYLWAVNGFTTFYYYIVGFINWWIKLFPISSEYNTSFNISLVHWIITIGVCISVFFLIRCIKSLYVIIIFAAILFTMIISNGFNKNLDALGFIIAGSLPLLTKNNHIKLTKNLDKVLTSRRRVMAAGLTVCVLCTLLSNRIVPKNTSSWKNPALSELLNRTIDSQHKLSQSPFTLITSGLQPNVDRLGGDIELDHKLVMKVKTNQPALMKGNVYNIYTGKGWKVSDFPTYQYGNSAREFEKTFCLNLPRNQDGENPLYDVMPIVNTNVSLMFGGYSVYYSGRVTQISAQKPAIVRFKSSSELYSQKRLPTRYSYSFKSTVFNLDAENLADRINRIEKQASQKNSILYDSDFEAISKEYLQLPENLPDFVYQAAKNIAGKSLSNFEKIVTLENYFKTNFEYTLNPGDVPNGVDFVEHFLKSGKGYCTYFASAMTVMSRIVGVPARFVIGYGLQRNGKNYAAYTDNAHAWVECYFRGVGWIPFDPTAGTNYSYPVTVKPEKKPVTTMGAAVETTFINQELNQTTNQTTNTSTTKMNSTKKTSSRSTKQDNLDYSLWLWLISGITTILLIAITVLHVLKQRKAYTLNVVRSRFSKTTEQIDYYYTDIIRQLSLLGLSPQTGETILQHGKRVQKELDKDYSGLPLSDGTRLVNSFNTVMNWRYGKIQPTDSDIEKISQMHDILENKLKSTLSPILYFIKRLLFSK